MICLAIHNLQLQLLLMMERALLHKQQCNQLPITSKVLIKSLEIV